MSLYPSQYQGSGVVEVVVVLEVVVVVVGTDVVVVNSGKHSVWADSQSAVAPYDGGTQWQFVPQLFSASAHAPLALPSHLQPLPHGFGVVVEVVVGTAVVVVP